MSPFCPTSQYMAMPIKALSSTIPFHCSWFPSSVSITCEHLAGTDAASWVRHTSSSTERSGEKGPHKDTSAVILLTHLTRDSILSIDPKHTTLNTEAAPLR